MVSCGEMKVGEVYVCKDCGLELEVKKSCGCPDDACRRENQEKLFENFRRKSWVNG